MSSQIYADDSWWVVLQAHAPPPPLPGPCTDKGACLYDIQIPLFP